MSEVAPGSPAARLGLRTGDVILEVNGTSVGSTEDLERIASAPQRMWRFAIERDGRVLTSVVGG